MKDESLQHHHDFDVAETGGERRTRYVAALTAITMIVEIVAGTVFGSMALLADGWHMGTHVLAFVITLFAYSYARRHAKSGRYTFGTGKVSVLGGFTSAVVCQAGIFGYAQIYNYSAGGMLIRSDFPISPGTLIKVNLEKPLYSSVSNTVDSRVVWCRRFEQERGRYSRYGLGVSLI